MYQRTVSRDPVGPLRPDALECRLLLGMERRTDPRRPLPVWFLGVWLGSVLAAALLGLTVHTSYQRFTLAGILLAALAVGGVLFRSQGVSRKPSARRSPQKLTAASVLIPVFCAAICYAARFAIVAPGTPSRGNLGASFAGLCAGFALALPATGWMWRFVYRRRNGLSSPPSE